MLKTFNITRKMANMAIGKKKIIIVSVVIVILAVLIAVTTAIMTGLNKPQNVLKALRESVDLEIKGFVYTEVGEANMKWEVTAETATYDRKQNLAILDQVQIKLTTADGKVFEMSADKGQMDTEKKDIEIKGNVVIHSDAGDRFTTDYIYYSDLQKKFYTDAPVTVENERMKITGKGMALLMDKGELNIPSTVKAIVN
jgi:lipopolysaccharide export system protein LptC